MSIVLNPLTLKKIGAFSLAKRLNERRSSEDDLERKRQKRISEIIALKTVDYDDLSSNRSSDEPNYSKFEPVKSVVTPPK